MKDTRKIKINEEILDAVFDTGANALFITSKTIKNLTLIKFLKKRWNWLPFLMELWLTQKLHRNIIRISKEKIYYAIFASRKDKDVNILSGNNCLQMILHPKELPIECAINTGDASPFSNHRPMRSLNDRKDFQKLVYDFRKKE